MLRDPAVLQSLDQPPSGFTSELTGDGQIRISCRVFATMSMMIFLTVWLCGWSVGVVGLAGALDSNEPDQAWLLLAIFVTVELFIAGYLLWLFFGRVVVVLDHEWLLLERRLGPFCKRSFARRDAIAAVQQIKDGGEGSDSFPSWGLQVQAKRTLTVIYRQAHEKSAWLGPILADWAGKSFRELPHW